jgi:cytochrome c
MTNHPLSLRIFAVAAAATALSACGGGDKPATETAETTVPAATREAPAVDVAAPAAVAPAAPMVTYASLTGDAANGEKVFGQCRACHVADPGVNRVGPTLHGLIGRTAGKIEGFKYSPANKNSGLVWTEEQVFTYLVAPQKTIPGTYMAFALKKPQDRADVIAYLKTRA